MRHACRLNDMKKKAIVSETEPLKLDTGAPSALAWIAKQEAISRNDYELRTVELNALIKRQQSATAAEDGTDWAALIRVAESNLEFARERVQAWQKSLREFDKSVAPEKRDASEKITQAEGEQFAKCFAIYLRAAIESFTVSIIQPIRESKSNEDGYKLCAEKFRECMVNAIDGGIRETHLPGWFKKAVEEVL